MKKLFVLGDYGTGGSLQKRVAAAMSAYAAKHGAPLAMVSTGDNIYPKGVQSADDPQWTSKFERIYDLDHLRDREWIAVLGNHDYRGSVKAQVEYSKKNSRWNMPSYYFAMPCPQAETLLTLFCLDTQSIMQKSSGWEDQLAWLKTQLSSCTTPWKIVVGHHPMRSYGYYQDQTWMLQHVKPLIDAGGVAAYMCGHDHDLQIIRNPDDQFACVVSGGGGGCRTTSWGQYSKVAATGGGFAVLHVSETTMIAQIVSADGDDLGSHLVASKAAIDVNR